MATKINIDQFADYIAKELANYTIAVADDVKQAAEDVAENMLSDIKGDAPVRKGKGGGKYKRAMRIKTAYESNYDLRKVWYVQKPRYRLSHLLEKGHALRRGGRQIGTVKAYPHIAKNEEKAIKEFNERVEEAIRNGGK